MSETRPLSGERDQGRQEVILAAAFQTFASYGFRRSSMDDIARAAGLSRTALYLHFRNKEDIFQSLIEDYFTTALAAMQAALARPGQTPEQALYAAFQAKDGPLMDVLLNSPHGDELMRAGESVAKELIGKMEATKILLLADWLRSLPLAEGIGGPEDVARTIMVAAMGLKFPGQTLEGYRAGQKHLAALFGRAITRP
jgi:AcrR family transcriptional regulator